MSAVGFAGFGHPRRQFANLSGIAVDVYRSGATGTVERTTVGELGADDHAVFPASSRIMTAVRFGVRCRVSLMLLEPRAVQGRFYTLMPLLARRFHRVFTHYPPLVARIGNARLITHGGSWLQGPVDPAAPRPARVSLIASDKTTTEGHRLRHRVAAWAVAERLDVRLLGRGYQPFDNRADGFLPYSHSVVIENSRDPGYFTEKLVDCLLCGTVPIYWGDPDIGRHFDLGGMIACRDEAEIRQAMRSATAEDFESRRAAILRNAALAREFAHIRPQMARILFAEEDPTNGGTSTPACGSQGRG